MLKFVVRQNYVLVYLVIFGAPDFTSAFHKGFNIELTQHQTIILFA